MVDVNARFRYSADFAPVQAQVRALSRDISMLNASFVAMDKAALATKRSIADSFVSGINSTGQFKASIVDLTTSTEQFGKALDRRTLSLREYFREARKVYQQDSRSAKLAERQVRLRQAQVIGLGAGPGGRQQAMVVQPLRIDTQDFETKMQLASEKYAIFNRLVDDGATKLINWGKNTQWAGRQLTVGLTMPLVLFGAAVSKTFRDVDKELTRFAKVYGSDLVGANANATEKMKKQIQSLAIEYSRAYGIAAKETAALAADLAATGLEGEKLLGAVAQTTRLAVLGEVDRQEAMQTTLALQSAFMQSTKELADSINFLNAVENQTSASLQDFTAAIPKAGPVVRQLGGDVKDLAVMLTAMREGGIPAAEAANAIKSGLASMINPTKAASERLAKLGVDIEGIVNRNRGQLMPTLMEFGGVINQLDSFARAKVIEELFGKYQFARISALFDNLNRQGSQTAEVLTLMGASSADLAKVANKEITSLTESVSMRFTRAVEGFKAALLPIGEALTSSIIPFIEGASTAIGKMIDLFNALPEPVKNAGKFLLGLTAIAGPIIMLGGVFANFLGYITKGILGLNNFSRKLLGLPTDKLEILDEQTVAAARATDILTDSFNREASSLQVLNRQLQNYLANLKTASSTTPGIFVPGSPARPAKSSRVVRRSAGGPIPGYGGGDIVPALLEPGESVITKEATAKFWPVIEAMNKGRLPGFNRGAIFLGMPRGYKDVQQAKQIRETLSATNIEATTGRFSKLPVTDIGTRITSIGGRSSSIPGVNGIYEEGGKKYVVKTHDTADSALAEVRGTQLTRDVFGLKTPVQELIKIKHPVTGDIIFAVRSPYDTKFAKSTGIIDEKNFFSQALAAIIRRDKDLQPDNLYGNIVTDVGQAFIANKASQPRTIGGAMPSVAEQTATNFLMEKGGARKWFAESTAEMAKRMSEDEYVKGFQTTIADAARKAKGAIGNLPYMTKEERAMYERIIDDLDEAAKIDWGAVYQFHRGITPEIKRPPTAAALAKKEAQEAEKARQRGQMAGWEYGLPYRFQSGGKVPGGYGGGDKVPAMLEPGEFVVRKEVASKNRVFLRSLNAGMVKGFNVGGQVEADSGLSRSHVATAYDESGRKIFGGVVAIENQGYNQAIEKLDDVFPGNKQPVTFEQFEESKNLLSLKIREMVELGKPIPRFMADALDSMESDYRNYLSQGREKASALFKDTLAKRMAAGTLSVLPKSVLRTTSVDEIFNREYQEILDILSQENDEQRIRDRILSRSRSTKYMGGRGEIALSSAVGKLGTGKFGSQASRIVLPLYAGARGEPLLPTEEARRLILERNLSVWSPGFAAGLAYEQGGTRTPQTIPITSRSPVGAGRRTPVHVAPGEVLLPRRVYADNGAVIDENGNVRKLNLKPSMSADDFMSMWERSGRPSTLTPSMSAEDFRARWEQSSRSSRLTPSMSAEEFRSRWEQSGVENRRPEMTQRRGAMGSTLMNVGFAGSMLAGMTAMNGEVTAATTALTAFTTALMVAGTALEVGQMFGGMGGRGGFGKGKGFLGLKGAGNAMAAKGGAMAANAGGMLGRVGGSLLLGGGRALALLGGPVGIAVATAATIGILIKTLNDQRIEDMKKTAKAAFSEATQSAEYFGVELGRTAENAEELRQTLDSMGIEMSNAADQVDQDFIQRVGSDFEDLIGKLRGATDVNAITTDLENAYSSLIAKGFGKEEADAIIEEVAKQAQQTEIYLNVKGRWQGVETPAQAAEAILENAKTVVTDARQAIEDARAAQRAAVDQYFQTDAEGNRKYTGPYRGSGAGGRSFAIPGAALKTGPAKDLQNANATLGQLAEVYGAQMNVLMDAFKNAPAEVAPLIAEFNKTVFEGLGQGIPEALMDEKTREDYKDALYDYGGQLKAAFEQVVDDETLREKFNALANTQDGLRTKTLMLQAANLGLANSIYAVVDATGQIDAGALDELIQKVVMLTGLNEQFDEVLQEGINGLQQQAREIEDSYDKRIKGQANYIEDLQEEAEISQENHEDYMDALDAESRALDDRAEKIQNNAEKQQEFIDKQIESLQLAQEEASFNQQQRERAFGVLGALMSGDSAAYQQSLLDYAQAQEDRQRELAIQGLEEKKSQIQDEADQKLDAIQKEKDAISERARVAQEAHEQYLEQNRENQEAASKRIQNLEKEKNKIVTTIQNQINLLEEEKAMAYRTEQDISRINGKLKTMAERLPKGVRDAVNQISQEIFGPDGEYTRIVNGLISEMATALNVSEAEVRSMLGSTLRGQYGTGLANPVNPSTPTGTGSGPGGAPATPTFRSGGKIEGPGTQTSDSIIARLSRGEYVVKASSVNRIGTDTLDYINNTGKIPGYATGGEVAGGLWGTTPNALTVLSIQSLQDLYTSAVSAIQNTTPGTTATSMTGGFNADSLSALGVTMEKAQQVLQWIQQAGWPTHLQRLGWALAMRESFGTPDLGPGHSQFNGEDYGLFQLNKPSWGSQPWWSDSGLLDPVQNARAAYEHVAKNGTNFLPWAMVVNPDGSYSWNWSSYAGTSYASNPALRGAVESNTLKYWNAWSTTVGTPTTGTVPTGVVQGGGAAPGPAGAGRTLSGWPAIPPSVSGSYLTMTASPYSDKEFYVAKWAKPIFEALMQAWQTNPMLGQGRLNLNSGSSGSYDYRYARAADGWSDHAAGAAVDFRYDVLPAFSGYQMTSGERSAVAAMLSGPLGRVFGWGGNYSMGYMDEMHFYLRPNGGMIPSFKNGGLLDLLRFYRGGAADVSAHAKGRKGGRGPLSAQQEKNRGKEGFIPRFELGGMAGTIAAEQAQSYYSSPTYYGGTPTSSTGYSSYPQSYSPSGTNVPWTGGTPTAPYAGQQYTFGGKKWKSLLAAAQYNPQLYSGFLSTVLGPTGYDFNRWHGLTKEQKKALISGKPMERYTGPIAGQPITSAETNSPKNPLSLTGLHSGIKNSQEMGMFDSNKPMIRPHLPTNVPQYLTDDEMSQKVVTFDSFGRRVPARFDIDPYTGKRKMAQFDGLNYTWDDNLQVWRYAGGISNTGINLLESIVKETRMGLGAVFQASSKYAPPLAAAAAATGQYGNIDRYSAEIAGMSEAEWALVSNTEKAFAAGMTALNFVPGVGTAIGRGVGLGVRGVRAGVRGSRAAVDAFRARKAGNIQSPIKWDPSKNSWIMGGASPYAKQPLRFNMTPGSWLGGGRSPFSVPTVAASRTSSSVPNTRYATPGHFANDASNLGFPRMPHDPFSDTFKMSKHYGEGTYPKLYTEEELAIAAREVHDARMARAAEVAKENERLAEEARAIQMHEDWLKSEYGLANESLGLLDRIPRFPWEIINAARNKSSISFRKRIEQAFEDWKQVSFPRSAIKKEFRNKAIHGSDNLTDQEIAKIISGMPLTSRYPIMLHGTARPVSKFGIPTSEQYLKTQLGPYGIYTSNSLSPTSSYARGVTSSYYTDSGAVLRVSGRIPASRILDLRAGGRPIPKDIADIIFDNLSGTTIKGMSASEIPGQAAMSFSDTVLPAVSKKEIQKVIDMTNDFGNRNVDRIHLFNYISDLYFKDNLMDAQVSGLYQATKNKLAEALSKSGYDAVVHSGGRMTMGPGHTVTILLNPQKHNLYPAARFSAPEPATFASGGLNSIKSSSGPVVGRGTPTSDSILARVSNGEYIIRASSVDNIGVKSLDYMNQHGKLPQFALGGPVNPQFRLPKAKNINTLSDGPKKNESGDMIEYNINIDIAGTNASAEEIANKVLKTIKVNENARRLRSNG